MHVLKRVKIKGFRGFVGEQVFDLDQCFTALLGGNGSGKSSTLNAIEWALYGDECVGKDTGIRERVGWKVPNQHLAEPAVRVELELETPQGTYFISRSIAQRTARSRPEQNLQLALPDGSKLENDEAEEHLAGLLQCSFRDFQTTAYQHQETIRAVLMQEPRDRNDAFDRLLGLSPLRNLLGVFDSVGAAKRQRMIQKRFQDFEQSIQSALAARAHDLVESKQAAQELGITPRQLTPAGAQKEARAALDALQQFAKEANLQEPAIEVPKEWSELEGFEKRTRQAVSRLRGQVPGIEEQAKLHRRQSQTASIQADLEHFSHERERLLNLRRELDAEHGDASQIDVRLRELKERLDAEQARLRETNGRAAVIHEAIEFLDGLEGQPTDRCPVCERSTPDLLDNLRCLWRDRLQAQVERIMAEIASLQERRKQLQGITARYTKLQEELETIESESARLRERTALFLERELTAEDDPLAVLRAEVARIKRRLAQLETAIAERQARLDSIDQILERVRCVRDYLVLERKRQFLERIQESEAFRALESVRDQVAELVADVEAIKEAAANAANEEAKAKLSKAEKTIDEFFREVCRHPGVKHLQLNVESDRRTGRNSYDVTDQDGNDLVPVLNQGGLNALALAIFLGLAATAKDSCKLGFLLMDDPSQSLGSEHKQQLARLLDKVARHKKLIVATMDNEFEECLRQQVTRSRSEIHFGKWSPETGVTVERR